MRTLPTQSTNDCQPGSVSRMWSVSRFFFPGLRVRGARLDYFKPRHPDAAGEWFDAQAVAVEGPVRSANAAIGVASLDLDLSEPRISREYGHEFGEGLWLLHGGMSDGVRGVFLGNRDGVAARSLVGVACLAPRSELDSLAAMVADAEAIRRLVETDAVDRLAVDLNILCEASHDRVCRRGQPV